MNHQKGFTAIFLIFGLAIILTITGAYYLRMQKNQSLYQQTNSSNENLINFSSSGEDDSLAYFQGQITAPSSYYVTSDSMLENYASQGGMAPPRLILMKNYQVFSGEQLDYNKTIYNPQSVCIVVWSTNGFTSIDEWNGSITDFKGNLTEKEEINIGTRKASTYQMIKERGNIYVGLLIVGNKDNTSYYFHTCNTSNKQDFLNVIKSIKFRKDLNLQ